MEDLHALIADAFIKWNEEKYVLLRIRVIVVFLLVLYVIMFLYSGLFYFSIKTSWLSLLDVVSEAVLAYTLGAMQTAAFRKFTFPLWALALVSFRSSIGDLNKYGTFSELRNVLKILAVAFLNVKHGSKMVRIPFWLFWSLLLFKCLYRIVALSQASKSLWHSRSSEILEDYMGHDQSKFNAVSCNPETMAGYRYLVYYGRSKQRNGSEHTVSVNDLRSIVTLEEIWEHFHGDDMRHLSLAFALSLLLRCRLEGAKLHAATVSMTRKLICSLIRTSNANKLVSSILKQDLLFLTHYLHTGYPMVFCQGLLSVSFSFIQCVTNSGVGIWLFYRVKVEYMGPGVRDPKFALKPNSADFADLFITMAAIELILILELIQVLKYILSKWTVLLIICNYVNSNSIAWRHLLLSLLRLFSQISVDRPARVRMHGGEDTGRYDFLQSFTKLKKQRCCLPSKKSFEYSTWKWNMASYKVVGIKLPDSRKRVQNVNTAVIEALSRSMDLDGRHLARELPSPTVSGRKERYWWASLQLAPRCSHVILVWHIATSLCEMKLAQDRDIDLRSKPGLFSFLEGKKSLSGNLQTAYTVANCLSQYCAYLLVSKPELLPEPILVAKKVLQDTVQHAHEMLEQCESLQSRYDTLIPSGATVSRGHDIVLSGNILQQGAILANELITNNKVEADLWQILAEVWADLLVHIAPSTNAEAHAKNLEFGQELITVIWALFCHCGIEKSKLWPDDSGAEETIQGHLNRNSAAGACAQQMATPGPHAAPHDSEGGDIEE